VRRLFHCSCLAVDARNRSSVSYDLLPHGYRHVIGDRGIRLPTYQFCPMLTGLKTKVIWKFVFDWLSRYPRILRYSQVTLVSLYMHILRCSICPTTMHCVRCLPLLEHTLKLSQNSRMGCCKLRDQVHPLRVSLFLIKTLLFLSDGARFRCEIWMWLADVCVQILSKQKASRVDSPNLLVSARFLRKAWPRF
jgi:hypothetical protein